MRAKVDGMTRPRSRLRRPWAPCPTCAATLLGAAAALSACGGDRLPLGGGGTSGCVPGVYAGTYTCNADASFLPSATGDFTLTLQGDRGGATLTIAADASLSGAQAGEVFDAPVTGSLDCSTYRLNAAAGNVEITSSGAQVATVYESESMSAEYDPDASPPAFVNGVLVPSRAQPGLGSSCTWTAKLRP